MQNSRDLKGNPFEDIINTRVGPASIQAHDHSLAKDFDLKNKYGKESTQHNKHGKGSTIL